MIWFTIGGMKHCILILIALFPAIGFAQEATPKVDFNRDVKPILSDRCFLCHGPDGETREADLRLDQESGAESVLEHGNAEESDLFLRIISDDDDQMPPADSNLSLTVEEKETLRRWINEGAIWDEHWSFVAPVKRKPPKTKDTNWPISPVDQFVLAKIEGGGLTPAKPATKEKLLRRMTFDLTGLPPTLAELDEFLSDESGDAYEKAVDRLLASSRYGERMTADWLDVARYSDTYGYQVDRDRFVWPWRDWVVRSFNKNMSYDQFVIEQLAGDLLENATDDQILATTFNRLHPQKVEGGSVEEEFRVEYVADRSQTMGMAFMGLTVECARCHDHKYDPLSQKEYYQLFAYFNNIDESGLYSYFDAGAIPTPTMLITDDAQKARLKELREKVSSAEAELAARREAARADFLKWAEDFDFSKSLELSGLQMAVDFEKTANGKNKLVDVDWVGERKTETVAKQKGVELTGDDEIKLETGAFRRHQPFTISARIKIPNDENLLKRSVIYHRTRAWTDSASRGYQLLIIDGKLSASLIHFWPGNAIRVETEKVPTDKWIQVSFVYDGSSRADGIKIFIDGKKAPVKVVKDNLEKQIVGGGTDRLIIGARFRDIGFKGGQVTDMNVFERELSGVELSSLHQKDSLQKILGTSQESLMNLLKQNTAPESKLIEEYYFHNFDSAYQGNLKKLEAARAALNKTVDGTKEIMVMRETATPRQAYVLTRGAYDAKADPVSPATPAILPKMADGQSANRLGLARWLVSPKHPLTARVAVNHYWQLLFGMGLVRTPEDFGSQGEPPTHPELLDWLAVDFVEHGWDVKRLLKQIVMTSTYQQSTAVSKDLLRIDPDNRLLARAPTFRLPAEMIRDNVLFTSGLMVDKIGGAPVRPYELAMSFQPATPDKGEGLYRRSLYTYWKRTGPAPVMLTLDAAKRDVCQVKRERTSSPLAALVQLNNPQTVEASRNLANKLIKSSTTQSGEPNHSQVAIDLFRTLTSRMPDDREAQITESLFESQLEYFKGDQSATQKFLAVGESKIESKDPAVLAAWASVANTLFSFDECVMRR